MKIKTTLKTLFLLIVFLPLGILAQDGSLDANFGLGGIAYTNVGSDTNFVNPAYSLALQIDGKIVVSGNKYNGNNYDFATVRFNSNGSLDTSFGTNGMVITNFEGNDIAKSVAIQSDGKILVTGINATGVGSSKFALFRYNPNGSLDTTFDFDGIFTSNFNGGDCNALAISIQNDGKIILAGDARNGSGFSGFACRRLISNGSLDSTFGTNGKVFTLFESAGATADSANSVSIQSNGKIVLTGSSFKYNIGGGGTNRFAALRYNSNGSLDNTFDNDGKVITTFGIFGDEGTSLALQNDGKILIGGNSAVANFGTEVFAIVRLNVDGSLDTTFDNDGKVTTLIGTFMDRLFSTIIQNDGKILVSGYSNSLSNNVFTLVRYNTDGSLDTSFDMDGIVNSISDSSAYLGAYSLALQTDGKIVAAGLLNNSLAVVRLNNPSLSDNSFENRNAFSINPNPFSKETVIQTENFFENASLLVYNSMGQLVKTINNINGQSITVSRDNLPSGLYFVNLTQENRTIGIEKLLIAD